MVITSFFPGSWPCRFISEGCLPFVVITLYDMEPYNLSFISYWFAFLKESKRNRANSSATVASQKDVSKLIQTCLIFPQGLSVRFGKML